MAGQAYLKNDARIGVGPRSYLYVENIHQEFRRSTGATIVDPREGWNPNEQVLVSENVFSLVAR